MTPENLPRFKKEINSFFALVLLNLVFGAMAMVFGMQFIVTSVLGQTGLQATTTLRALTGIFAMVCFGLGLSGYCSVPGS